VLRPIPRVSLTTLGCRLNQAETAQIAERFRKSGYVVVEHGEPVDVAVIHTCSVTERADQRCRQEIRRVHRQAPHALVCAVGCYAQSDPETVAGVLGVDLVVGNDKKYRLPELVAEHDRARGTAVHVSSRPLPLWLEATEAGDHTASTRANLKVQDGCSFTCRFCHLPRIRGAPRSRPVRDVLTAARELHARGHREIVLTGVNIGLYRDGDTGLADLARLLEEAAPLHRIRLSSIEPSTVSEDLLTWIEESPAACRYLHVPLQSGDDGVLQRMSRVGTTTDYSRLVDRIKSRMPELGLGTDVLVGFPGETDEEFETSLRFVTELPFDYLHVFSYSDRPRTVAERLPEKVASSTVTERSKRLRALGNRMRRVSLEKLVGRRVEVLLESKDDDGLRKGLTREYHRIGVDTKARENDLVVVEVDEVRDGFALGHMAPEQAVVGVT